MPIAMNLSGNALFGVPGGYPVKLSALGQMSMTGIVPKGAASVSAAVYADKQANVHMAIYAMPTTATLGVPGSDGAIITDLDTQGVVSKTYQADIAGLLSTSQTLTLTMPTTKAPTPYVLRLWVDGIVGTTVDTLDRDADGMTTDEAPKPVGVNISQVSVA
jgi:hypothetical protein